MKKQTTETTTAKVVTSATSLERKQINRDLLVKNLSKLYKDLRTGTIIPREVLEIAKDAAMFKDFRDYMIKRHNLKEGEQPKRGWSVWFALEWCEKQIKAAAADEANPSHAKAVAYLRAKKAELQDKAAKLY